MPLAYSYQTAVVAAASYGKPQHAQRAAGSQEGGARGCTVQISLLVTIPGSHHLQVSTTTQLCLSWTLAGLCPVQPCETLLPIQDRIIPSSLYVKLCLSQGQEPACQATVDMANWSRVICMSIYTRV